MFKPPVPTESLSIVISASSSLTAAARFDAVVVNEPIVPMFVLLVLILDVLVLISPCNSFIASPRVVAEVLRDCVGSTYVLRVSISVSNSAIAPDTVDAVVPIAPAEIVPSSASISLIAVVAVEAEVVRAVTSPSSLTVSLIAADILVADNPVNVILPISVSCSLMAPINVEADVFNPPDPIESVI